MTIAQRYQFVIAYFQKNAPDAESELNYGNAYELLVAVMLSAQCTDKRVNLTTPSLFKAYPDIASLARARFSDLHTLVKSISYPNSKSRHLIAMAKMVRDEFGGEIPSRVEDLIRLPGVGRKTAHVITSVLYGQPNLAVDTHVFRVAARIGLTRGAKNPLQAEKQLRSHLKPGIIPIAHHWLILHGRYICTARNPKCPQCGLKKVCAYYHKTNLGKSIAS